MLQYSSTLTIILKEQVLDNQL